MAANEIVASWFETRKMRSSPSGTVVTWLWISAACSRVGFTDHAVAAVALGGVEAGIGAFEQQMNIVVRFQHGNPDREGDAAKKHLGHRSCPHSAAAGRFPQQ